MTSDIAAPKRNGLAVLADIVLAPQAAFASLKSQPTWLIAFVVTSVLGMIGSYLQIPAAQHATAYLFAHDPRFAALPADSLAQNKKVAMAFQSYVFIAWPIFVLIGVFFSTLFLMIGNAIGKGTANFAKLFALSANVGFLNFGLGFLILGAIVRIRGGDAFQTQGDIFGALPGLGMLVPGTTPLHFFLASFTVMQIWSIVILSLGFRAVSGVKPALAYGVPIGIAVLGAIYTALTVH